MLYSGGSFCEGREKEYWRTDTIGSFSGSLSPLRIWPLVNIENMTIANKSRRLLAVLRFVMLGINMNCSSSKKGRNLVGSRDMIKGVSNGTIFTLRLAVGIGKREKCIEWHSGCDGSGWGAHIRVGVRVSYSRITSILLPQDPVCQRCFGVPASQVWSQAGGLGRHSGATTAAPHRSRSLRVHGAR